MGERQADKEDSEDDNNRSKGMPHACSLRFLWTGQALDG
jgi:hypothetical protein